MPSIVTDRSNKEAHARPNICVLNYSSNHEGGHEVASFP